MLVTCGASNSPLMKLYPNNQYKNIMTANAFLSSNCTVEDNVSASRLFLPKELHISDEWRKSEQRLTASNTSNMSSPIHNFNICGTSVTPMELFAQMTAHYKQISENCNYAQSMELFLTNPSVITQLASMNISDSNNNPLTVILTNSTFNELVEKLNLLISNSTFSDLFHSSLENHCKLQPYIKSSSPNLLSIHLKHIQSDSFQSMPKSLLQTNEIELNTTNSSTSFIVEQNFSAKNLATDNNTTTTTKNDINNICDSNIPLSLSMITSDQANLLHKDSIINDPHETLTNNVYSDHSNLLLNYTTTNKNDPNENNNITGKDNKINSLLTEAYFNSIKDYHLNNHHENIKFYEQYKQQTNTSIYSLQKRSRTRLNETQLNILRSYFDINNSPSDEKINEICNKTGLQEKVVKHWFRNTLFKERQKNKDNPYNFSIPPSTSLNIEEYEKTGRIELNNNNSFKQNYKLLYLNNNNNNEQNDKDKMNNLNLETNSNDLIIMKDKMNNDLYSIDQSIENENINNGSLNSTMKRSCEMESLKIIDQWKWTNQNKRQRLEKDIQDGSLNDEVRIIVYVQYIYIIF
ncbi:hypothetical protein Smp_171380 [Schistosoma mansoni]|uniref:hypothetical protein n=1 Tax=Schistosoma mansoni TaxID=6183 RepID=UPI00022DCC6E|nr:hypothetical protein Smp_171380 [Schistosoma mansoni]|eukprot:XP_018655178.1 hypothetical protein Smp_171380 [Schistosoma mansoni]